jgi:plasmid stabilization system protein ParE
MRRAVIRWCRATNISVSADVRSAITCIFHRVGTNAIEVVHVPHGARDYERLLFPET